MAFISYASARKRHEFIDAEAADGATWARPTPGAAVAGDLNLQIDVDLAVANAVALT